MEHKQTEPIILNTDEAQGIVEAIWAVMGNVDGGGDIIHPGAFTKTFKERGSQVKLLDNHRTDSVMSALGTVLELKELPKSELPSSLLEKYPDATGGAWGKFQFLMKTPEGKGAFDRIESKAVGSWSFGYDTVLRDHSSVEKESRKVTVRNLRELKLYEISCVLFPMNEATTTTGIKAEDKELVNGKPVRRLGDVLQGSLHKLCTMMCDEWYIQGYLDRTQHATVMAVIDTAANTVANGIPAEIADFSPQGYGYYYDCMSKVILSEIKAGRVLSARNATRIKDALNALNETLKEAGLMEEAEEIEESSKDGWLCDTCYKALGKEYECFTDPILPGKCAYCGKKEVKHHLVKLPKNGATEPQESNALTSDSEAEPLQDESTRQIIELELLKLLEV